MCGRRIFPQLAPLLHRERCWIFFNHQVTICEKMFCGGSFRSKTIETGDDYCVISLNDRTIKIKRSASLNKADHYGVLMRNRRIVPPKVPQIKHCVPCCSDSVETVSFHFINKMMMSLLVVIP